MKVLQVMPNFSLAGAEIMCENLVYALTKRGVDVVVVSFYDQRSAITERLEASGIRLYYLGKNMGIDFSMIGKLKKIMQKEKPDVIHTHRYAMQYAVPAAILSGVKARVHTVHNIATKEFGKAKRIVANWCYKHHNVCPVALSEIVKATVIEEYGIQNEKIPVVYNGIDLLKCNPKSIYMRSTPFRILHIGRFSEQKNHDMLLHAFAKFHEKHADSELLLLGDGELRPRIEELISDLGLSESVTLIGVQSDVCGFLHDADAFVLPSLYEGIPMTLIEAMGTALPIVATAVGGVPDMLKNGESAMLTSVDVDELVRAFSTLYGSEELRRKLGTAALAASNKFSADEMARKYLEIYDMLIKR